MNQPQRVVTVQPPTSGLRSSHKKAQGTHKANAQPAEAAPTRAGNDHKRDCDEPTADQRPPALASTQESLDAGRGPRPCEGEGVSLNPSAPGSNGGGAGKGAALSSTPSPAKPGDTSDDHVASDDELSLVELYEERGRVLHCRITNLVNQEKQLLLPTPPSSPDVFFRTAPIPVHDSQPPPCVGFVYIYFFAIVADTACCIVTFSYFNVVLMLGQVQQVPPPRNPTPSICPGSVQHGTCRGGTLWAFCACILPCDDQHNDAVSRSSSSLLLVLCPNECDAKLCLSLTLSAPCP